MRDSVAYLLNSEFVTCELSFEIAKKRNLVWACHCFMLVYSGERIQVKPSLFEPLAVDIAGFSRFMALFSYCFVGARALTAVVSA